MNIHPIFVHFPVALLSIYALLELIQTKHVRESTNIIFIKAFLVLVGTFGAFGALFTGDPAEHIYRQTHHGFIPALEAHQTWAGITIIIFIVISLVYIVRLLAIYGYFKNNSCMEFLISCSRFFSHPVTAFILALMGLCAITITGALGGSLVYGTASDPFIGFIYHYIVK